MDVDLAVQPMSAVHEKEYYFLAKFKIFCKFAEVANNFCYF